jgi:hypothetical protein
MMRDSRMNPALDEYTCIIQQFIIIQPAVPVFCGRIHSTIRV